MTIINSVDIKSICIVRLSAIGDVCHALAVVQAIAAYYPNAEITWVIGRVEASLFKDVANIRFVIFDKKAGVSAFKKLRQQLPQRFDLLLHMQVALRANLVAACIKARRRIGFAEHLSKEGHGLVITERASSASCPHVLEGLASFASAIGVTNMEPDSFKPCWSIPIAAADEQWANKQLERAGPNILVVSPAASNGERNWFPERYAAVIDYASSKGFTVVITGSPSAKEQQLASQIIANCQCTVINLVAKSNLTQLLAVLKRASVVISPDSGPAHMATTQGTPVIGLYAHSNPTRTGPYYSQAYVVEVYHQHLKQQFGKTWDQLPWGKRVKGNDLMADISVAAVINQFDKVCVDYGY